MNKKLIIGVIVVIILGFSGFKIWTDHKGGETKEATTSNLAKSKGESKGLEEEKKGDIEGTNSTNSSDNSTGSSSSTEVNNINSSSNKNDDKNSSDKNTSKSNSNNIKLPYIISDADVKIEKITSYSGTFVENGSDKKVSNILSLVVKNTSKKDIQYCSIEMIVNGDKKALFNITNLPSGKTATVLESTGKIPFKSESKYNVTNCTYAGVDKLPMNSNKVKVSTSGSRITIKNISNKDLGTVYVYYKNAKNDSYLGGITYRVKFENVEKGKELTTQTSHFSKSSKVVMVDTEK